VGDNDLILELVGTIDKNQREARRENTTSHNALFTELSAIDRRLRQVEKSSVSIANMEETHKDMNKKVEALTDMKNRVAGVILVLSGGISLIVTIFFQGVPA
jgi:hypothetical protein